MSNLKANDRIEMTQQPKSSSKFRFTYKDQLKQKGGFLKTFFTRAKC